MAFGKKSQICGIYAGPRVDEVADNVFVRSSRINSTWGGNLVDMVRSTKFIEIIEEENLADNVAARGQQLVSGLRSIARDQGHISNVRGQGSMVAFTLESPEQRDEYIRQMHARQLLVLASGEQAIRFRMSLVVTEAEIDQALERIADCSPAGV